MILVTASTLVNERYKTTTTTTKQVKMCNNRADIEKRQQRARASHLRWLSEHLTSNYQPADVLRAEIYNLFDHIVCFVFVFLFFVGFLYFIVAELRPSLTRS